MMEVYPRKETSRRPVPHMTVTKKAERGQTTALLSPGGGVNPPEVAADIPVSPKGEIRGRGRFQRRGILGPADLAR